MTDTAATSATISSEEVGLGQYQLTSISIIGGFLDGATFDLANGLNCVIGARGTGKTTILELVRFALDALPAPEVDSAGRRRIESLVQQNLGGGRVQLAIETKEGLSYVVSRSAGEDPIVLTRDGAPTEITFKSGGVFKADIYSQNEVEGIADRALSQLVLIDNFEPDQIADIGAQIGTVESKLATNASAIGPLEEQIASLAEEIGTLPGVEEKLKGYASVGGGDAGAINQAHAQKALRDRERRAVEGIGQFLGEYAEQLEVLAGQIASWTDVLFAHDVVSGPNGEALTQAKQTLRDCGVEVDAWLQRAGESVKQAQCKLAQAGTALTGAHARQEMTFRALIEKHQAAQGQAQERSRLEKLRNDLLAKRRTRDELHTRLTGMRRERTSLLEQLSDLRNQRFAVRQSIAERINAALLPAIRVSVIESGNPEVYRSLLENALRGSRIKHGIVAQRLVNAFWPVDLSAAIQQGDVRGLMDQAELNHDQAERVIQALSGSRVLFDLETVELIDLPRIELKDGKEYKDTESLSTGQKCTTILPILLLDSENPLLVDQPEDNLDNRFIYECVVESIQRVKARRQLIFVTHNPNIPVLGDAERVFVLESDGTTARKANEGTVDHCKDDIITLLEGGREAFKERERRYA